MSGATVEARLEEEPAKLPGRIEAVEPSGARDMRDGEVGVRLRDTVRARLLPMVIGRSTDGPRCDPSRCRERGGVPPVGGAPPAPRCRPPRGSRRTVAPAGPRTPPEREWPLAVARPDGSQWRLVRTTPPIERLTEAARRGSSTPTVPPLVETVPMPLRTFPASGQGLRPARLGLGSPLTTPVYRIRGVLSVRSASRTSPGFRARGAAWAPSAFGHSAWTVDRGCRRRPRSCR